MLGHKVSIVLCETGTRLCTYIFFFKRMEVACPRQSLLPEQEKLILSAHLQQSTVADGYMILQALAATERLTSSLWKPPFSATAFCNSTIRF